MIYCNLIPHSCLMVCTCRMLERIYIFIFPDTTEFELEQFRESYCSRLNKDLQSLLNLDALLFLSFHVMHGRCMGFSCKYI